jgi:nucleotide-binding universal stress UspA family protein
MKVLYATDGEPPAEAAAALIEAVGNRAALEVTALAVTQLDPYSPEALLPGGDAVTRGQGHAHAVAEAAARRLADAGFRTDVKVAIGPPGRRIVEAAAADGYDLVVVGAGNHEWLGRLLLGSASTHVLQHSPVSVLVVNEPPQRPTAPRVLLATDGSPEAMEAALTLGVFADPLRCRITVLSVAQVPALSGVPASLLPGYSYPSDVMESLVDDAERAIDRAAGPLRSAGFHVDTLATDGAAHHLIVRECVEGNYDLAVVGSRGLGRVQGVVLGSVSQSVARHARAALIVRTR